MFMLCFMCYYVYVSRVTLVCRALVHTHSTHDTHNTRNNIEAMACGAGLLTSSAGRGAALARPPGICEGWHYYSVKLLLHMLLHIVLRCYRCVGRQERKDVSADN